MFPADAGDVPPGIGNKYDAGQAGLQLRDHSSGVGGPLGLRATAERIPLTGSLVYGFMPPIDGNLLATAMVSVTGTMGVLAEVGLHTFFADARLTLGLRVYQQGVLRGSTEDAVADLHCGSNSQKGRVFQDDFFVETCPAFVQHGEPVVIEFTADLYARGQSDFAHADLDFTQSGRPAHSLGAGIRVLWLCLDLEPAVPVVVL